MVTKTGVGFHVFTRACLAWREAPQYVSEGSDFVVPPSYSCNKLGLVLPIDLSNIRKPIMVLCCMSSSNSGKHATMGVVSGLLGAFVLAYSFLPLILTDASHGDNDVAAAAVMSYLIIHLILVGHNTGVIAQLV